MMTASRDAGSGASGAWSRRPGPDEHHGNYSRYVDQVPDGDVLRILEEGVVETRSLLKPLIGAAGTHRYAPGKWSVREVVGHLTDTERLFGFRALHIARGDEAELPAMDQEAWAEGSNAHERPLSDLVDELESVRAASLHLFRSLPAHRLDRRGVASGFEFTVRSFPWIVAGHEIHHRRVLEERYLPTVRGGVREDG